MLPCIRYICRLVDWLVDWLVGRLVGRFVDDRHDQACFHALNGFVGWWIGMSKPACHSCLAVFGVDWVGLVDW